MKVVLLAGGYGTRISEESVLKPKPMIEIGDKPIIWHIMKLFSYYGFNDFIICAGYKQQVIKEWFADYYLYNSDITFDFSDDNKMSIHNNVSEPWRVTVVDTGHDTMTGGRIKRIEKYVENAPFFMTYGDGVSDVNITDLYDFHQRQGKIATLTAVKMIQRFGVLDISENNMVQAFREKSTLDSERINGGFMVLEPDIFDYIKDDNTVFEKDTLEALVEKQELACYKHDGFWQCMDTKREKEKLDELWSIGQAPWKKW